MESFMNHFTFGIDALSSIDESTVRTITARLEEGRVAYLSNMAFSLNKNEMQFLSPNSIDSKSKNISYHPLTQQVRGCEHLSAEQHVLLQSFMQRYYDYAKDLIHALLPSYVDSLEVGRTSYRPVEIKGRPSSYRKDDTLLHVDAFPSMPVQGRRILRVFCNVNPHGQPRVWNLGESFTNVVDRFLPTLAAPNPIIAPLLKTLTITKGLRTPYDHYMLQLHNAMKADSAYQANVAKMRMDFPPETTWIVFTDKTSHAALTGQYLLEQTFYLPTYAMQEPQLAPLHILETKLGRSLTGRSG